MAVETQSDRVSAGVAPQVMNDVIFPERLDFGVHALGETARRVVKMVCKVCCPFAMGDFQRVASLGAVRTIFMVFGQCCVWNMLLPCSNDMTHLSNWHLEVHLTLPGRYSPLLSATARPSIAQPPNVGYVLNKNLAK